MEECRLFKQILLPTETRRWSFCLEAQWQSYNPRWTKSFSPDQRSIMFWVIIKVDGTTGHSNRQIMWKFWIQWKALFLAMVSRVFRKITYPFIALFKNRPIRTALSEFLDWCTFQTSILLKTSGISWKQTNFCSNCHFWHFREDNWRYMVQN